MIQTVHGFYSRLGRGYKSCGWTRPARRHRHAQLRAFAALLAEGQPGLIHHKLALGITEGLVPTERAG